jgi:predicted Zn-dependent protease
MRFCGAFTLLLACQLVAAQDQNLARSERTSVYSPEKESALGKQMASEVRKRTTPIGSPSVTEYLYRIGRRISAQMPEANFAFEFSVIYDDPCPATHEPVSLPGGFVFVPAALIVKANDEAELAGMLAHAMEHIAQHHAMRQPISGQLANYGSIPLVFLGGWSGCPDSSAVPMRLLATGRNNEMEADALTVPVLSRAGFDPEGLARYIGRFQPTQKKEFSPLPDPVERSAELLSIAKQQPTLDYEVTSAQFAAIQLVVERLVGARDRDRPALLR